MSVKAARLDDRSAIRVAGADARKFLQDLVTGDVAGLAPGAASFSALLQPQGKILFDFFLACEAEDAFLLDTPAAHMAELARRLTFYKLRAKLDATPIDETHAVAAFWGGAASPPGLAFADPRLGAMGGRVIAEKAPLDAWLATVGAVGAEDYHAHRIALAVPEGGRDFAFGEVFPHEADMDQLHGIAFDKGCFVGQEVVSRMRHRGTARRRFVPVSVEGPLPASGAEVKAGDKTLGTVGTGHGDRALAMLRLDRVEDAMAAGTPLRAGDAVLTPLKPGWADFAFPGEKGGKKSGKA